MEERMRQAEREQLGSRPYADAEAREHDREMNVTPGMVKAFQMATRYAVPEDMAFQGITVALFARLLAKKSTVELHPINLDPYPATVGELAEEFVRTVVDLEESGAARNLVREVRRRLWQYAEAHEEDPCQECNRPRNGVSKGCHSCRLRHPEMYRHAYGEVEG